MKCQVSCATGYEMTRVFADEAAAQAWIDRLEQLRDKDPALCAGPHTIVTLTPKETHDNAQT